MVTDILLEQQPVSFTGALTLRVDQTIEIKVSAETVQRRVSRFVHMEISTQMHAETPVLVLRQPPGHDDEQDVVVGDQATWRVPVHLTFPAFGNVGRVGSVHVAPVTGAVDVSQSVVEEIGRNASNLVERLEQLSRSVLVASSPKPRAAGLHRGAIWISDDFDESLSV